MSPDTGLGQEARLRRIASDGLTRSEIDSIRRLLWAAFPRGDEGFSEEDWDHALGGMHFLLELGGRVVSHAAVVERDIHVGGRPLRTGYVEAVATDPADQGRGYGSIVMRDVNSYIEGGFELGALGTGSQRFYERLGWRTWRGPSSVRTEAAEQRTPDEDGYILVLPTPATPELDIDAPISCEWRPGDVW